MKLSTGALPATAPVRAPDLRGWLRVGWRLAQVLGILLWNGGTWATAAVRSPRQRSRSARARWLRRVCQRLLVVLGVRAWYEGHPPAAGLIVSNHLSYLDVIVLGARQPLAFVAKREVRGWPLIGWLAECGGTLFIDRERRRDVARVGNEVEVALRQGTPVCIFAEGTSSDGSSVRPFRPSLLQPAVSGDYPVTPAWIGYRLVDGSVSDEVCYWRDMTFAPHFLHLLSLTEISAEVRYGLSRPAKTDRKELATQLHAEVTALGGLAQLPEGL